MIWPVSTYVDNRIIPFCVTSIRTILVFANKLTQVFYRCFFFFFLLSGWPERVMGLSYYGRRWYIHTFFFWTCSVARCLIFCRQPCQAINSIHVTGLSAGNVCPLFKTAASFIFTLWICSRSEYIRNKNDARKELEMFQRKLAFTSIISI